MEGIPNDWIFIVRCELSALTFAFRAVAGYEQIDRRKFS
jgi:hypothetical protein